MLKKKMQIFGSNTRNWCLCFKNINAELKNISEF